MSRLGPVLVADDEPLARLAVRGALAAVPSLPPIEECATGHQAVDAARARGPSLLVLDIGLPDLDGFGVIEALGPDCPPVVMVTASAGHAVEAFREQVVDYVVKPFSDRRLIRAARRGLRAAALAEMAPLAEQLLREGEVPDLADASRAVRRFAVRGRRRTRFVPFDDVDFIRADGNYAVLVGQGREYPLRAPLASLEERLAGVFCRIHRSTLVHLGKVAEIRPRRSGDADVVLRDGQRLRMSRRYRDRWRSSVLAD